MRARYREKGVARGSGRQQTIISARKRRTGSEAERKKGGNYCGWRKAGGSNEAVEYGGKREATQQTWED